MPTGEDTTDEDLQEYPEVIQGDDGVYTASVERAQLKQKHKKEETELNNQQYLKEVSWDGMNRTYTSNYREAVKNAAGWAQFYDEADEAGNPIERSDVFTIDPATGMPVGVMGRSQRRNWDMQRHQDKIKSTLTDDQKGAMEDSAAEIKTIHSDDGLETVIGGEDPSATTEKVTENIDKTLNKDDDDDDNKIIGK